MINEKKIINKFDNKYKLYKIGNYYPIYRQKAILFKHKYNDLIN